VKSKYLYLPAGILDQSAVFGIDIILSESSEEDSRLSHAITQHAKVVLPVYIDRQFNISHPAKAFSPARLGHVHLEQGIDGFVKEVFHTISHQSKSIPSFASALNAVINGGKLPQPEIQDKIPQQKVLTTLSNPTTCGLISMVRRAHSNIFRLQTSWMVNGPLPILLINLS